MIRLDAVDKDRIQRDVSCTQRQECPILERVIPVATCMIHQHVSFPYDPATGQAVTDLKP